MTKKGAEEQCVPALIQRVKVGCFLAAPNCGSRLQVLSSGQFSFRFCLIACSMLYFLYSAGACILPYIFAVCRSEQYQSQGGSWCKVCVMRPSRNQQFDYSPLGCRAGCRNLVNAYRTSDCYLMAFSSDILPFLSVTRARRQR